MRRIIGSLVVLLLLGLASACGEETETETPITDPPPATTADPSDEDDQGDEGDPGEESDETSASPAYDVQLLHASAAGGATSETLVPVGTDAALTTFLADLTSEELVLDVREAVADAAPQDETLAAVVALGCDVPETATVTPGEGPEDWTITASVPKRGVECLAPVTTVAVVTFAS